MESGGGREHGVEEGGREHGVEEGGREHGVEEGGSMEWEREEAWSRRWREHGEWRRKGAWSGRREHGMGEGWSGRGRESEAGERSHYTLHVTNYSDTFVQLFVLFIATGTSVYC